ncbi:hypothetical protein CRG98_018276 [Punica granatum]|uniref:Uncharacterized protein n=1 Tax=Punica granatum TaxID=22663 RepID=A0A2I0JYD4_PUNGR|nr:hypothetical protein CRG98_018276 [Punica granatum]
MLSKTAWALTKTNNSLAGRAIKAKYGKFLNTSNRSPPLQFGKDFNGARTPFRDVLVSLLEMAQPSRLGMIHGSLAQKITSHLPNPMQCKQADLHETIKTIKRPFMEHTKSGSSMDQSVGTLQTHPLELATSHIPTSPDWSIISTDAAWNSSRTCLSRIIQCPNNPPSLSWFQIYSEDKPLQAEAQAALLALLIGAERGLSKIWLRCDAFLHPHNSPWEIWTIVADIISYLKLFLDWLCS